MVRWQTMPPQQHRVEGPVLGPFGQVHDQRGAFGCVRHRPGVPQVRADLSRVGHGDRVMNGYDRPLLG